jgi:D-alanine-D-alanine ligase
MPASLDVVLLYNRPSLPPEHPDYASEAGVLEAVEAAEKVLTAAGHRLTLLGVGPSPDELVDRLRSVGPQVVFNLCEGLHGGGSGEAQVAGIVELLGIPLTGSPSSALALVRDKARTKWLLSGAGLPTADFCLVPSGAQPDRERLAQLLSGGAVIVKPAQEDASLGIGSGSVLTDLAALEDRIRSVARYGDVLVERFIAGREFNAGIVGWPQPRLLPLAEIEFDPALASHERLVTYEAKWSPGSPADRATAPRCPANVSTELAERLGAAALGAFLATNCRDYARVDLRVDERGEVFILEVNGNPDISPSAGLARAIASAGESYEQFICRLVEQAWSRRSM